MDSQKEEEGEKPFLYIILDNKSRKVGIEKNQYVIIMLITNVGTGNQDATITS